MTAAAAPGWISWADLGSGHRGRCPPQSPAPGFGEKYWSLSGFPSHSLESGGGAFLTVIFGQAFAYSAFRDSHFSTPGSVSERRRHVGEYGERERRRHGGEYGEREHRRYGGEYGEREHRRYRY
jgi:hypothetical protein